MAVESLILVSNPGSASRKYALFKRDAVIARFHFEYIADKITLHFEYNGATEDIHIEGNDLTGSLGHVNRLLQERDICSGKTIGAIALRIVAPSEYFLQDRVIGDKEIQALKEVQEFAPLHVSVALQELSEFATHLPNVPVIGISDSAAHAKKPDYTWNYGINLGEADRYGIKRFGYHGISVTSVITQLRRSKYTSAGKVIICHLGSGSSVTAIYNGTPIDTTMGYSPNEGLIMATRSGAIDFSAGLALATKKNIKPQELAYELNTQSGLLGISGHSSDIRALLKKEQQGNYRASLALSMYVYSVRQAIASMAASMGGVDLIVFTGTVGQRSAIMRSRIIDGLTFLGLAISQKINEACTEPYALTPIHPRTRQKPVLVVPTDEAFVIQKRARRLTA